MVNKNKKRIAVSLPKGEVDTLERLSGNLNLTKSQLLTLIIVSLASWDLGKDIGNAIGDYIENKITKGEK